MLIQRIDSQSVTDILEERKRIKDDATISDKFIELDLENTDGDEAEAIKLVSGLHEDKSVYPIIKCKGDIKLPGTLLAIAGKPGFRKANKKTTFELISPNVKDKDSVNEILSALSAKPKLLSKELEKKDGRQKLTPKEAVDLGIVDEIETFHSVFKESKRKKSTKQKEETSA
ncbi:hypothetical protein [Flavobacterium filum]|uniref:hypothetical protein n=1 Tax=Flavobacterium filum TaxID=370974 RepID=UPI0023F2654F|nr:hypothetical protein [Flavobacterium filum]